MARRSKEINIFNMSFMDVLSCAFGAVLTLFLITSQMAGGRSETRRQFDTVSAQLDRAEQENRNDREDEAQVRKEIEAYRAQDSADEAAIARMKERLDELRGLRFLGVQTRKRNIVLLIDLSGSMVEHEAILRRTARILIGMLRWDDEVRHRFNIITFQTRKGTGVFQQWKPGNALYEAEEANRKEAQDWLERAAATENLRGDTPTVGAFQLAFTMREVEAVFVLTDGEPTDVQPDLMRLKPQDPVRLARVRKQIHEIKPEGVEIRCIGIGERLYEESGAFRAFLESLAFPKQHGYVGL